MVAKDLSAKLFHSAAQAPSGDNAQPWRFEVKGNDIELYNVPGKDYSPYNFRERGSLFANGAAIENMVIAAASLGYSLDIILFPNTSDETLVARLTPKEMKSSPDPLIDVIESRTTNRKPYPKTPLSSEHKAQLISIFQQTGFGELRFLEEPHLIKNFASIVSLSDRLIFEEKSIHDAIFGSIRWTKEEEEAKRGMYIKTLELPPPAQAMFKMLRNWSLLTTLNHIGISRFIAAQSAVNYASSSAIGMMVIPDDANRSYVRAGRAFQRLWLAATQIGVTIQPVAALAYLAKRIEAGDAGEIAPSHAEEVVRAQKNILELFGNPTGTVAMMFRIGYGAAPSAHSQKSEPAVTYAD